MNRIKTIVIDDEQNAISSLLYELQECPEIELLASFTEVDKAEDFIASTPPDLLFLDIHMPILNGISFLKKYPHRPFEVIFTTAHIEHAFEAYKNEIIAYLLKPVSVSDIKETLSKYHKKINEKRILVDYEKNKKNKIIALNLGNKERLIQLNDILYCEAQGNYTSLFLINGERLFITHKLKYFEEQLGVNFFRIHKSYLVNLEEVLYFDKKQNLIHLKQLKPLPISRLKRREFIELLKK